MSKFIDFLRGPGFICFDGGMGTMLQSRGLTPGMSPEFFCLENPDVLVGIHREYIEAGADVITTNTFGGTRLKLPAGLEVVEFNRRMAAFAREAAQAGQKAMGRPVFVAGSIGPTGHFIRPLGEMSFREMVAVFREQIRGLVQGGVDLLLAETHFDLSELKAVVVAAREECALPVGVSMTFESGMSLTGTSPLVYKETMLNMGVDIISTNCSAGPREMQAVAAELLDNCPVPMLIEPNAGLPELENGNTVFRLGPEEFAALTADFAAGGAKLLGGCCGTTPAHIAALRKKLNALPPPPTAYPKRDCLVVTSRSRAVRIGGNEPLRVIGERINPTGKKLLTAELQQGRFALALQYAEEQTLAGAPILDVNVGAPGVDEPLLLPQLVEMLAGQTPLPLCLDSANPKAVEAALETCPGAPLVNSINGEPGRVEALAPLCLKYGSPFILLPLTGGELPRTAAQRIAILDRLLEQLFALDVPKQMILVDVLALTVSASPDAGRACLETIRYCDNLGLATSVGLSNVSFGMPAREILNAAFLNMAAGAGLSACIANPGNRRLMEAVAATNALLGKQDGIDDFVNAYADWKPAGTGGGTSGGGTAPAPQSNQGEGRDRAAGASASGAKSAADGLSLEDCVIKGRKDKVLPLVEALLEADEAPFDIVQTRLIPAITAVGEKYERKEYFLPQLLKAAETMQTAFARLKPLLEEDNAASDRPVVIMATVEGDIHDIGKNIVILMLSNHGFEVIDLGKDVKAETIVEAAINNKASLIGLSALMTTTMVRMEDTIALLKEKGLPIKVMVGGAVVTEEYARAIGASGYSADAVGAVKEAKRLLGLN